MANTPKTGKRDIVFPIGFKLVTIITILLLVSLGAITVLVSVFVGADVRRTAEENNFSVNHRSAAETELTLGMIRSNTLALLDTLSALERVGDPQAIRTALDSFFERNAETAAIIRLPAEASKETALINEAFFRTNEANPAGALEFTGDFEEAREAAERALGGELVLENASAVFGIPVMAMFCPRRDGEAAAIFFTAGALEEMYGTGTSSSYMVNDSGRVLLHADAGVTAASVSLASDPFVTMLWGNGSRRFQTIYTGQEGREFIAAFEKLTIAHAAVVTRVEESLVFEGVVQATRRNLALTGAVLFLSILFIWFFSKTLSGPLKKLAAAAGRIEAGEYELSLSARSRDEVGYLTRSFVSMGRGLAERERLKDTFGRFINKDIAEKAMKGELTLGGENKTVTIFFSDIRAFTAISETMSPQDVVGFLNSYLSRMVDCVDKTGGVVDKFIGDAIMAIWGAPVSSGSHARDALNCVRSALMMRVALQEYNRTRSTNKRPPLKIGCGINSGDVVAGQIGSSQRMEYTVIGDAVNLASRTESLNKPLGTDILITENTWDLVGEYLITQEMPPVQVKGKVKPVRMFAVINLRVKSGPQPAPTSLKELRAMLGIAAPKLSRVNVNAEEKKYKIGE
ncbi:MAG: adenylate/guanylate cyclase domain-containing protein [Treponema sp.]|nr:adenylate/guanylate cyclase domain-containing protein [Treponema sp.]